MVHALYVLQDNMHPSPLTFLVMLALVSGGIADPESPTLPTVAPQGSVASLHDAVQAEINKIILPPIQTKGLTLDEALTLMNSTLANKYPNNRHLPIIIERHQLTRLDLGGKVVRFNLDQMPIGQALNMLSMGSLTHWIISENGYVIFKTWHRPQYEWDDDPPENFRINQKRGANEQNQMNPTTERATVRESEPKRLDQPAAQPSVKPPVKDLPSQPTSKDAPR